MLLKPIKKHAYVKGNLQIIKRLTKSGDISSKLITDYNIYLIFTGQQGMKMQRYQDTADICKTSTLTVMKAVKSMESKI